MQKIRRFRVAVAAGILGGSALFGMAAMAPAAVAAVPNVMGQGAQPAVMGEG